MMQTLSPCRLSLNDVVHSSHKELGEVQDATIYEIEIDNGNGVP